jgi:membrane-associated phospholipid phosphatase
VDLLYLIAAFAVVVPAVAGPLLAYKVGPRLVRGRLAVRTRDAVAALVVTLGRPVTSLVFVLFWGGLTVAIFWPVGLLAHSLENAVDWPVLLWVTDRRNPTFEEINSGYTLIGDRDPLKPVVVASAVVFALLWRRRFWIPLLAILAAFPLEQYVQAIVSGMVDRGHPPTGLGSYPSGGVARVVMTFGAIALFIALTWKLSRRWHVALGTIVLVMASYEGYSRIYAQKHWITDVVSGLAFGPALYLGYALAVVILAGRYPATPTPAAEPPVAEPPVAEPPVAGPRVEAGGGVADPTAAESLRFAALPAS